MARIARTAGARLERVLAGVRQLADVTTLEDYPPVAIEVADSVVASDVTTFNDIDVEAGRMVVLTRPSDFVYPNGAPELLASHSHEHPLIRNLNETGDGSAFKISDFLSARAFHESLLYRAIYGLIGVEDQMAITMPSVRQHVIGLVVNRGRRSFTEDDRAALNLLRPHLAQAYRLLSEQARLARLVRSARAALEDSATLAIALGEPPEELTPGALVQLYRYFGRPGAASAFPDRVAAWVAREQFKAAGAGAGTAPELLTPLVAHRDGYTLVARLLPGHDGADVIVLRRLTRDEPSARHLQDLRLSTRESDVARLLLTGASNSAIAAALHIAPGTVKKHLDHIYRKLGATNRVAAVRTLLDLPAAR